MPRPKKLPKNKTTVVRLPLPLLEQIKEATRLMPGYSEADVIRLATEIGLVRLRRIKHKVPQVIDAAAMREIHDPGATHLDVTDFPSAKVAEEPPKP